MSPNPIASLYASASRLLSSLLVIRSSFLVSRWFAGMDVSAASSAFWSGVKPVFNALGWTCQMKPVWMPVSGLVVAGRKS